MIVPFYNLKLEMNILLWGFQQIVFFGIGFQVFSNIVSGDVNIFKCLTKI